MAGTKAPRRKSKIKAPKSKDRQTYIEGTEPPKIKEIESAAAKYVEFRDARMEAGEEEVKLKEKLIAAMKEHKLETYSFDGYMVELTHVDEDQIKVKKARAAKENGQLA